MKIEIDQEYIDWVNSQTPELGPISEEALAVYVNEVLQKHMQSWLELEES